ncbi:MAG TPA: non-canonical purine NTP pyrophosphatase [Gemmatimonas sp.]|uniref:non-canonical purine NTP pyrophosphatase n=1 Tax=Gemmatimonas sp. TaxID=1962908 RepID=UPI002ED88880
MLLATRSVGKLRELAALFADAGLSVETLADAEVEPAMEEEALEAYETFEQNALAKARYFAERTGRLVVADDSGLCVDALDGRPGVRSKRWSGRQDLDGKALDDVNNAWLLRELNAAVGRGRTERTAAYVCAAAAVWPDERGGYGHLVAMGTSDGVILESPRGEGGFGYDPYFSSLLLEGRTMAEVSREQKAAVSHRGAAVRSLLALLDTRGVLDQVARSQAK